MHFGVKQNVHLHIM